MKGKRSAAIAKTVVRNANAIAIAVNAVTVLTVLSIAPAALVGNATASTAVRFCSILGQIATSGAFFGTCVPFP